MPNPYVTPSPETAADGLETGAVGRGEMVEGLVAEHHPEPVGVARLVALEDRYPGVRFTEFDEDCQIEPGGAATNYGYDIGR